MLRGGRTLSESVDEQIAGRKKVDRIRLGRRIIAVTLSRVARHLTKNPQIVIGGVIVVMLIVIAIGANNIAPYPYDKSDFDAAWSPPSREYFFGTDQIGRDIFSRVIYGARVSLAVAIGSVVISLAVGVPMGVASGYLGGTTDLIMMRFVDIVLAFPSLLLMILLAVALKSGVLTMIVAIGITRWAPLARIVRAELLRLRGVEFIMSARALGASDTRIVTKHVLPNILSPIIVFATFAIPFAIMSEAGLGFIGIGVQPPVPSWGVLLNTGFGSFRSFPNAILAPAIAISICILAFTLLGNGLRDALDPRLSGLSER
jgi:ABC-type dipeptide/oligopeptide/nickel transport system permease subunit